MDINFSNFFGHLDKDQKRIATAFVLSIPIAYILCLRVMGAPFYHLDAVTRFFYSVSLSIVFMIANYTAIILGQVMMKTFIPYRYMQLFIPQVFAVVASIIHNRNSVKFVFFVYTLGLLLIMLAHILARLIYPRHNADTQKNQRHRAKKRKHRKLK